MQLCSVIRDTDHECLSCGRATKDMLPLPVTPWQGNTLTRWHGDTTPAPRHGVGSRLDSCVAHQDGEPQTAPAILRHSKSETYANQVRNHICLKATNGIHNKKKCVLKRFCHPGSKDIVAYPSTQNLLSAAHSAIHRWFVTRHLKYQSPDCVSWIQSTCYQLQCWSFFLRWHRLINASNEENLHLALEHSLGCTPPPYVHDGDTNGNKSRAIVSHILCI